MKMTWKKKSANKRLAVPITFQVGDDDGQSQQSSSDNTTSSIGNTTPTPEPSKTHHDSHQLSSDSSLAHHFLDQGNKLAEDGKYREALGKWETAITLMPEYALLHEQKAQVLLEIREAWGALKAATRATELDPVWAEAWTTLGRAQLNFGEPDSAIESFDKALAMKPDLTEAKDDRQTAMQLVKKRKQLQSAGLSEDRSRYAIGDTEDKCLPGQI